MLKGASTESEYGFIVRPAEWPDVTDQYEQAYTATMVALTAEMSGDRFTRYYRSEGDYAGVTFLDVGLSTTSPSPVATSWRSPRSTFRRLHTPSGSCSAQHAPKKRSAGAWWIASFTSTPI